jgi:hypothetical protein
MKAQAPARRLPSVAAPALCDEWVGEGCGLAVSGTAAAALGMGSGLAAVTQGPAGPPGYE